MMESQNGRIFNTNSFYYFIVYAGMLEMIILEDQIWIFDLCNVLEGSVSQFFHLGPRFYLNECRN